MKIIDNPALGIGLLLCIGVAVFGLAFMATADGQFGQFVPGMVTSDDGATAVSSMTSSDDSPFLPSARTVAQMSGSVRVQQAERAQAAAAQPSQRTQSSVRIETPPVARSRAENPPADPFTAPSREQQRGQQVATERRAVAEPFAAMTRQQTEKAEKRDELLFRIVKLRLQRGEFEQIVPVALQMQNPEKVIEMMLDLAETLEDEEKFAKLLDVATMVLLHLGQPRPPVMGMMPGGMSGPGMPGMTPFGMTPFGMTPDQR